MGLFDFLKPKQEKGAPKQVITVNVTSHQAEMLEQRKPVISRGSIDAPPDLCAGHFRFDDVPIAENKHTGGRWYLLSGDNAEALAGDMITINEIVDTAREYVAGLPDMMLTEQATAFTPCICNLNGWPDWRFCRLIVEPYTETGKLKKYPVRVTYEDTNGIISGCFEYDKDGVPSKGRLRYFVGGFTSYKADWIGGVLSHVKIQDNKGELVLYNKKYYGSM